MKELKKGYLKTDSQLASLPWRQTTIRVRDQFFFLLEIFLRQLRVCYFVAPSLTRGRACNSFLLLRQRGPSRMRVQSCQSSRWHCRCLTADSCSDTPINCPHQCEQQKSISLLFSSSHSLQCECESLLKCPSCTLDVAIQRLEFNVLVWSKASLQLPSPLFRRM
jgi:hypothetical protein